MDDIEAFWQRSQQHARLVGMPSVLGVNPLATLRPPDWSFGATPEHADGLLELVLDGTKTATASALWDYEAEGEELPSIWPSRASGRCPSMRLTRPTPMPRGSGTGPWRRGGRSTRSSSPST